MSIIITLLILVILVALVFEYINGFHDSANAIATVVATKVLSPKNAVLYGATLNFVGAFSGTHVAKTISSGILNIDSTTQTVILCALIGAVIWNLITWYYGIPSSSSHALIGGLLGASIFKYGIDIVNGQGLSQKILIPMFVSPILGLIIGFTVMLILIWIFHKANPEIVNKWFRKLQLLSSGIMAFSHGSNDAQKTMGIMTLALVSISTMNIQDLPGWFPTMLILKTHDVPFWVIFACALTMGLGTMAGGWKIIRTMGTKVIKLKPIHGFAAETSSAAVILTASHFGIPISTTHVISTSIMGVGSTLRLSAVKWTLVFNIVFAWVVTIPVCMIISGLAYAIINHFPAISAY